MRTLLTIITLANLSIYVYICYKVFKKWHVSKAHRRFFFLILASLLWILAVYLQDENISSQLYSLTTHANFALAALIAGFVVSFAAHFPREGDLTFKQEIALMLPIVILSILSFSNLFINPPLVIQGIVPPLYYLYVAIIIIYFIVMGGGILLRKYINSDGIIKLQLRYILLGYLITIVVLLAWSTYFNLSGGQVSATQNRILLNSSVLFSFAIAYAMLRYRLFDIKIIIKKSIIYLATLVTILFTYIYLLLFFQRFLQEQYNWDSQISTVLLVLLIVLTIEPLRRFVARIVNKVFYARRRETRLESKRMQFILSSTLHFKDLIGKVSVEFRTMLGMQDIQFLLNYKKESKLETYWPENVKKIIVNLNDPLFEYLRIHSEILVTEEIPYLSETKSQNEVQLLKNIERRLQELNVALVLPIGEQDELIGVFLFGPKERKEAFTLENLQHLSGFRNQTTFALANALLYKQAVERINVH